MKKFRIPLAFTGLLALAVMFPLFLNTYKNLEISTEERGKLLNVASESLSEQLAEAINLGDIYNGSRNLSNVCNVLGAVSCRILDPKNNTLFVYPTSSSHGAGNEITTFPLTYGGKLVGRIEYE